MSVFDEIQTQRAAAIARRLGIPEWMVPMLLAEAPPMSVQERRHAANVHQRPGIAPDRDAGRVHKPGPERRRGTGWIEARPLGLPDGVAACDRIADAFADRDRREASRK